MANLKTVRRKARALRAHGQNIRADRYLRKYGLSYGVPPERTLEQLAHHTISLMTEQEIRNTWLPVGRVFDALQSRF